MSTKVELNSGAAISDINPIANSAGKISAAGAKTVELGGETNLPGAKKFLKHEMDINNCMKNLSIMITMDVKDALRVVGNIEGIDDVLAKQNS